MLDLGGEWFQAEIQQHHEQGGQSDQPKPVVRRVAPGAQHQPRDAAGSEQDHNPHQRHRPGQGVEKLLADLAGIDERPEGDCG